MLFGDFCRNFYATNFYILSRPDFVLESILGSIRIRVGSFKDLILLIGSMSCMYNVRFALWVIGVNILMDWYSHP